MYPTIQAAAAAIREGRATPLELLDQCLARIDQYEDNVKAWVFIDRRSAREQAEKLTAELKAGRNRGPLHGIPLGIKDIIDVADWPTAAGSKIWSTSIAREDAELVKKLRQAGAVFLGKTETTQYASFDPAPTRNPWNLQRTPGGSSSGSAAAVACGMCLGSIGSQTGGSLTRPAAFCGVATCKPTQGRVSCQGVLPLAPSMDHPGPMAQCVFDLAVILQAIFDDAGESDLLAALETPRNPRLTIVRGIFEEMASPPMRVMMEKVKAALQDGGATLASRALPAAFSEVLSRHRIVMAVEGAAYHEARWKRHPEDYKPNITKLLGEGLACPAPEYARCKEHQRRLTAESHLMLGEADALLVPATIGPAPDLATTGDPAFNSPWSYTGQPTISLPASRDEEGMPLSIQLVGRRGDECRLFATAAWCERVLAWKREHPRC